MDAHWLTGGNVALKYLALAAVLLPAVLILLSRRSRWYVKPFWMLATQLPWAFTVTYAWVWLQRYGDAPEAPLQVPLDDAFGWWMLAFPWAVYLLYRATRRHAPPA